MTYPQLTLTPPPSIRLCSKVHAKVQEILDLTSEETDQLISNSKEVQSLLSLSLPALPWIVLSPLDPKDQLICSFPIARKDRLEQILALAELISDRIIQLLDLAEHRPEFQLPTFALPEPPKDVLAVWDLGSILRWCELAGGGVQPWELSVLPHHDLAKKHSLPK